MSDPYAVIPTSSAPERLDRVPPDPDAVRRKAIAGTIVGGVGIVVLPLVASIVALALGGSALAEVRRMSAPEPDIRRYAVAAVVLGVIGAVIGVVSTVVVGLFLWLVADGYTSIVTGR